MVGTAYIHTTPPQPVSSKALKKRAVYREDDEERTMPNNIMFDRRVIRGNTYAAQVVTQNAQREVERLRQEQERSARLEAARRRRTEMAKPATPPPVEGRTHMEAQTETFLEVLRDKPIETDVETQTETQLDKEAEPLFVPSKTGMDKETVIADGELFDFDLEVNPILEVLVGKALRVSMIEVMEEEELESIRQQQQDFEQMRDAELIEVQRLDAAAARRFAEKQRRLAQEEERVSQQAELQEKVAARSFAKNYFADLSELVFQQLEDDGHFVDPLYVEVKETFMPWIEDAVVAELDGHAAARQCADALLQSAIELAASMQASADARRALMLRDAQEAADAAQHASDALAMSTQEDTENGQAATS